MSQTKEIEEAQEAFETANDVQVLDEIDEENGNTEKYIGQCKWFSDKLGYGFLTICNGDKKGTDIFSHHSGVKPLNSNYKTLKKGEYVEFSVVNGLNGLQAMNVTGINGGALMCDFVNSRKLPTSETSAESSGRRGRVDNDGWRQVHSHKYNGAPQQQRKVGSSKYNKKQAQVAV